MTAAPAAIEPLLVQAYRDEAALYTQALPVAEALGAAEPQAEALESPLAHLQMLLSEVAVIEARIALAKQTWLKAERQPGPELAGAINRVAELIQRLLAPIQRAEREATAQKQRLAPELDALVRGRQMLRAYGMSQAPSH